jgi:hypothetical protein
VANPFHDRRLELRRVPALRGQVRRELVGV